MKQILTTIAILGCVGLGWFVYQDSLSHTEVKKKKDPAPAVTVHVTKMQSQTIEDRVDLVGSLEAITEVELRPRISGYITHIAYDVGDHVEVGKLVAELDNSKQEELVVGAEAALNVAKAQLLAKKMLVEQAVKKVERYERLADSGVSTDQQSELAQTELEIANAEVELEEARVEQSESQLLRSKLAREETRILSPMAGYVAERQVDVGDLAKPDVALLRIVGLSIVQTVVHVVEKEYQKVKSGQQALIEVDAFPGEAFAGQVVRKAPVLDPGTRTAAVQIDIPNPNARLKPGMHARVQITFSRRPQVDVVPVASLVENGEDPTLYVIEGNPPQAELRNIKTGLNDGTVVEILDGIKPDDQVVMLGNRLIEPGQEVAPVEVPFPGTVKTARRELRNNTNSMNTGD